MAFFSTKKKWGRFGKKWGRFGKMCGRFGKKWGRFGKMWGRFGKKWGRFGKPVTLRGSAEQSPCFVPNTNKSRIKRHHTYIVFILQYYIFSSLFSI